jgi:hypothetical protein
VKRQDARSAQHLCSSGDQRVRSSSTASTVAFIAPGPPKPPVTQVMYVGAT